METSKRTPDNFLPEDVSANEIYKFLTTHWHHHNLLSWSKLYILFIVESAALAGSWQLQFHCRLNEALVLLVVATLVAIILWRLMLRDCEIRDYCAKKLDIVHEPLQMRMIPHSVGPGSQGNGLLDALVFLLVATNVAAAYLLKCGI